MNHILRIPALYLLALALACSPVLASEEGVLLRVSLVHGQNEGITDNLQECSQFRQSLVKLFGYQRYQRLGTATARVNSQSAVIVEPIHAIRLRLEGDPVSANVFHFQLFQDEEPMFRGKFVPKDNIPLIIRGPEYHRGLLILVVNKEQP